MGDFNARLAQEMDRDVPGLGPNVWGKRQALRTQTAITQYISRNSLILTLLSMPESMHLLRPSYLLVS